MPTPKLKKYLGRKRDHHDHRDLVLKREHFWHLPAALPHSVDVFAGLLLPIYDQSTLGACTANTGVLYRRFLAQHSLPPPHNDQNLSRMALYYWERALPWNNDVGVDGGAEMRDIFIVLRKTGVCPEPDDPYVVQNFADPPTEQAVRDAAAHKMGGFHRIGDSETAKLCLVSGYPVALGFAVYGSFENVGADGLWTPQLNEPLLGGHAVVIRGYDDGVNGGSFFVQNSWGPAWGKTGCFYVPYTFIDEPDWSQADMWMGHLGRPWARK
jgi:papain like protease